MRHYINITGNISAGCSTLTARLAQCCGWTACLERDVQNPFLAGFYEAPDRWAFHNQAYFVVQSMEQHLNLLSDANLTDAVVIQDYSVYDPTEVYSRAMVEYGALRLDELHLLERLFELMKPSVRVPDLLIYLDAPIEVLWERLNRRGRESERSVVLGYLEILGRHYERFIAGWGLSPVIRINTEDVDFRSDENVILCICNRIREALPSVSTNGGVFSRIVARNNCKCTENR